MFRKIIRPIALLSALAFTLAVCLSAGAQDTPGTIYADAEAVSATSVRIFWADDPLAEGYRVYRSGSGVVAEVAENINEYLDTGLTPGIPYYYGVASMVGGEEYWMHHPDFGAMPLDAPEQITILALRKVLYGTQPRLEVDLTWTPVSLCTGYEVYARAGENNEYNFMQDTENNGATISFPLPEEAKTYWFKVRIFYDGYYVQEYDYYLHRTGPFSPEVSATWHNLEIKKPIFDLFWHVRVWPWEDPYHAVYLKRILETYADPGLWPGEVAPDTRILAGLAGKLAREEDLTEIELSVARAIHPHGLALLAGVYLTPPDEEGAQTLASKLGILAGLMGNSLPDALTGEALDVYQKELSEAGALVCLKLEVRTDSSSLLPHLRFILPGNGSNLLNNLPGRIFTLPTPTPMPLRKPLTVTPIQLTTTQPNRTADPAQSLPNPNP